MKITPIIHYFGLCQLLISSTNVAAFSILSNQRNHATTTTTTTNLSNSLISKNTKINSHDHNNKDSSSTILESMGKQALVMLYGSILLASSTLLPLSDIVPSLPGGQAYAADSRLVGEIAGSGLVFKDTLNIESFEDPKVQGVTLYISNFQRPLTERLQKDFFSDPSSASVTCAKTGPVAIADNIYIGKEGEEVFEESRSLLFKALRVKRIYDKEKNTVVYVSFNTKLDKSNDSNKSRFQSALCAVNLN